MAIGTAPEIGATFLPFGKMSEDERAEWYAYVRSWGDDLMGGYGKVITQPKHQQLEESE